MDLNLSSLPDDPVQLKAIIASQAEEFQEKIHYLEERIRLLTNEIFGRRSEKREPIDLNQLALFTDSAPPPVKIEEQIEIPAHSRARSGRRPLSPELPRVDAVHDIPEEQKLCACGATLSRIGEETCEKLDYVPARVQVIRHIRYKYACKSCQGVEDDGPTVRIAPAPVQLIPKSIATSGLLAHIAVAKFADALPLYRQQKVFARLGVDLPRATMATWMIQAACACRPLIDLLQDEIRGGPLINIDESTLQVLKEPGRRNTGKSYMWLFRGGTPGKPALLYRYEPTRSGQAALAFLDDYRGWVQSDAFSGYGYLSDKKGIRQLGCWAHARRKFVEVVKVRKKHRSSSANPGGLADEALDYIGRLYQTEHKARKEGLSPEQIFDLRQQQARPVLKQFNRWLETKKPLTPPKGLLGQAIAYTLSNWDKLVVYLEDGRLKPDNNAAENALRPFVLGRKNWLFAGSPDGAAASATFFSLIETAKANGLEPYAYLRFVFDRLPLAQSEKDFKELLPQYVDHDLIESSASPK